MVDRLGGLFWSVSSAQVISLILERQGTESQTIHLFSVLTTSNRRTQAEQIIPEKETLKLNVSGWI